MSDAATPTQWVQGRISLSSPTEIYEPRHGGVAAIYGGTGRRSNNGLLWGVILLGAFATAMATFLAHRANIAQAASMATAAAGSVERGQEHLQATEQPTKRRVVVVGGGLAGSVAALQAWQRVQASVPGDAAQHFYEVVLVDKMPKLGGNSAKASSGINALHPDGGDSQELFEKDTLQSGGGLSKPDLVATLVAKSQAAIKLLEGYGVDLSKVTQLGGHSKPRSHTNPVGGNVGWSIMSKIMGAVKGAAPGIRTLEGHKLEELLVDSATGAVRGVRLVRAGADGSAASGGGTDPAPVDLEAEAVVLATGGFAANRQLLARHNPASAALATTNGPWAQGDALDVAARAGARLRDLEQVQVHPTGFVDPADEQAGTKFLAPEKLRGVGAVMLNRAGERFVDELGTRDVVSDALSSQEGKEAWLLLPASGAEEYGMSAIQFYVAKKLFAKVEGVEGLAQHTGAPQEVLAAALTAYNQAKEAGGADALGKTVFPAAFDLAGEMYVARVTPVVHYTMGGVEIDERARVVAAEDAGQHIHGLFAAGEVSGGVHGRNRLGGNSLLECVVYGTIAGDGAAARLLEVPLPDGAAQQSSL